MGISRAAVHYMMAEGVKERFRGRVVTFGVQQTTISDADLHKLSNKVGYPLAEIDPAQVEKFGRF